jgi:cell division protein FtsL
LSEGRKQDFEVSTWLLMMLVFVVLSSALALVYAKHNNRNLFIDLQALQSQRDELNVEWGRLQLEQSTFATHSYIEETARRELQMQLPTQDETVMVKP